MTTTIAIIIAILFLAALAKIFLKESSGPSSKKVQSSNSNKSSNSPEKDKKEPSFVKKSAAMISDIKLKGTDLFRPPPEPTLFTGRKEIQKIILSRATTAPITIGISGHPGVGKTCLAITLIEKFASQFSHNCLFIDMQGDRPDPPSGEDIMRRIILRFHPSQPLPADSKKLAKLYRVALKVHKGILILDNSSGVKQVKPLAPPPSWLMIVTSTGQVSMPNMTAIALEPMESLESHTLLTRWAPKISPSIKEISQICKGIPMALEIIGKLFAINSTMAPDYFTKKFVEAREQFGEAEKSDFVVGTRAAISLSYHMLPDQTAMVLKKLSVFPGSFTANAVSFICEDPRNLSLTGLEKYGLVQYNANTNRFHLHQLVKNFVKPLLSPGERNMTERRLAAEYMNVLENAHLHVEKGGNEFAKGLRLFDLELENIKVGMEWSRKHCAQDKDAAQMCSAYTENGAVMIGQRLSPSECIQWFEAALAAASQLEDKEAERKHLLNLGQQYVLMGQSKKAIDTLERALTLCKRDGDVEGQRTALNNLSRICQLINDFPLATKYLEENIELAKTANDEEEEFKLLVQLTSSCVQNREYNKAVHAGENAIGLIELVKDKSQKISLLYNLGKGYIESGDADKALNTLEKGLELSQNVPNAPFQGELFKLTAGTLFKTGDIAGALKLLEKGLEALRKAKDQSTEGDLMIQMAEIHIHNKNEDRASDYFEEVQILANKIKDPGMEGRALWTWSQALGEKGNLDDAIIRAQKALKIFEELKKPETSQIREKIKEWSGS